MPIVASRVARHRLFQILASVFAVGGSSLVHAAAPSAAEMEKLLQTSLRAHPRLLMHDDDLAALKTRIARNSQLQTVDAALRLRLSKIITLPPVTRVLTGKRLLDVSREFESRVIGLALEYRLTGDKRFADRATQEMLAVCAFSDWHPDHFLDVAEITAGMAIGYDWLYDTFSEKDRQTIRDSIVHKGIEPSYNTKQFWIDSVINWSSVCHGSLTLGSLAIAEDERALAAKTLSRAITNVPHALGQYAPDGAYPEGPGYWEYGTTFNVLLISALQSSLDSDFGLKSVPGFMKTGDFILHSTGPTGEWFNFSDSGQRSRNAPAAAMWWFAAQNKDDSLLFNELNTIPAKPIDMRCSPMAESLLLMWSQAHSPHVEPQSTHYVADGPTPVAFFRSSWKQDATYFGIKAGSPSTSHAQMDVGDFIFDMNGVRFGDDLGSQDYNSLETKGVDLWNFKQNSTRWDVFRISAQAQSVITVDGGPQMVAGHAKFTKSGDTFVVADDSSVYVGELASAKRGMQLGAGDSIRIQDELQGDGKAHTIRWAMLTRANVDVQIDNEAMLTRNDKQVHMYVTGLPSGAKIQTFSTAPTHVYDVQNPGTCLVGFEFKLAPNEARTIAVDFAPRNLVPPTVIPLASW